MRVAPVGLDGLKKERTRAALFWNRQVPNEDGAVPGPRGQVARRESQETLDVLLVSALELSRQLVRVELCHFFFQIHCTFMSEWETFLEEFMFPVHSI